MNEVGTMMRAFDLLVLVALLSGCHQRKPKFTDEQMQKFRAETPYLTEACFEKLRWDGVESLKGDCTKRLPPARWRGLWRDDFEGQLFCPSPARECTNQESSPRIWLEIEPRPATMRNVVPGGLYAVEFIGRRSTDGTPMQAYGYQQDMVVDRIISMKEIKE